MPSEEAASGTWNRTEDRAMRDTGRIGVTKLDAAMSPIGTESLCFIQIKNWGRNVVGFARIPWLHRVQKEFGRIPLPKKRIETEH